ncbi:hypothetical protein MACK_001066 [Theileria orientalis]|uniref:Uncharacterized protein n=1 Tax=Theileria orientalis TaxID=68886 RepID=A0A976MBW4_THEOR|nr:hypothetical protein MACK_001066 [Theileria orientalis]
MGARQSYLYIFLEYMDGQYGSGKGDHTEYTVESSKGVLDECDSFEVVTHKIQITKGDPKSYDIYIYNSRSVASKASYIFGYCSPRVDTHVAKEVKAYYSVLSPHTPLAITFVRENEHNHHCATDKLKEAGWDWASSITKYSSSDLAAMLKEQFTKLSWDRTIQFTDGKDNINIMGRKMEIDNDKFYRVILVPNKGDGTLGVQWLYCLDPPNL